MPQNLVDSHCHLDRLDLEPFAGEMDQAIAAAAEAGVGEMLCVGINQAHLDEVIGLANRYPQVYASVGVHPNEVEETEVSVQTLVEMARASDKVIAIGETGLDYFRLKKEDAEGKARQQQRFRNHISAAKRIGLPVIIHCREAIDDTLALMAEEGIGEVGGIMHCFVEDQAAAEAAMAMGLYISLSGIVTFNSAKALQEVARWLPADRLLLETDSPYLAPVPHRGKPNYPAYVRQVAEKVAELRGVSVAELGEQTTANFRRLFKLEGN